MKPAIHRSHSDSLSPPVREIRGLDVLLLLSVLALICLGTVMVLSATVAANSETLAFRMSLFVRHVCHIGIGILLMIGAMRLPVPWVQSHARTGLLLGLLALLMLFLPGFGKEVNGSLRWYDIVGISIQPSEFVKVAVVVYFADYLARNRDDLHLFKVGIIKSGMVVGTVSMLLLLQPDFGTTVVLVTTVAVMMFLAGVRFSHFLLSIGAASGVLAILMWMEPYRAERLLSYRDPWADPFGSGFQLAQALIAIGRGEWLGTGLGNSIQKLFYLPHAGNDFLIAVIGEELGAVAIFAVIGLFALILWRCFSIASRAFDSGDRFGAFLAQGVGTLLCIQASVHIAVNTGLLPTKGLTLPLMSYGGNSMMASMLALGLLIAVNRQSQVVEGGDRCAG